MAKQQRASKLQQAFEALDAYGRERENGELSPYLVMSNKSVTLVNRYGVEVPFVLPSDELRALSDIGNALTDVECKLRKPLDILPLRYVKWRFLRRSTEYPYPAREARAPDGRTVIVEKVPNSPNEWRVGIDGIAIMFANLDIVFTSKLVALAVGNALANGGIPAGFHFPGQGTEATLLTAQVAMHLATYSDMTAKQARQARVLATTQAKRPR